MSSLIYNSCLYNVFRSMIHFDTDVFNVILVTSEYIPDKDKHKTRSDIDFEIQSGNGYTRGGVPIDVIVLTDSINNNIDIMLNGATWSLATISAGGAVYYRVGGALSNDDLVCYVQFDREVSSVDGNFTITPSRIRIQN